MTKTMNSMKKSMIVMNGNKFKKGLILMNKTIALFTTVIAMIFISGIFAYVNTSKTEPTK